MRLCNDCDEPIPTARLHANPSAFLCLECQTIAERQGRFPRHKMSHRVRIEREDVHLDGQIVRSRPKIERETC